MQRVVCYLKGCRIHHIVVYCMKFRKAGVACGGTNVRAAFVNVD